MSRCFPYPPPGILRQGSVESVKLDRESVLPKSEQKLLKLREKKEKKKGEKGNYKTQSSTKKFEKLDDILNGFKGHDQLEKSELTEEHEPPVCYISDGSQSSHKRKRETVSYSECRVEGSKIKIKFSFKKPRQSDSLTGEEPFCSSNGRVVSSQNLSCLVPPVPEQKLLLDGRNKRQYPSSVPSSFSEQGLRHNDGRKVQVPSYRTTSSKENKILKAALQYKTLIEDWLPTVLHPELDDDENGDDWLLPKKRLDKPLVRRSDDSNVLCHSSSTSWPRAQYLPEAEVFALPYTVPF
ncbi:hypothetical protein V6N13_082884 [Hibiscus sabdariffa]|uniref:Uncharacterized protein n=1 Tax=Hibiscus sabdariffa TaxID=183260 RepID=A0ABR2C081_9ROSI